MEEGGQWGRRRKYMPMMGGKKQMYEVHHFVSLFGSQDGPTQHNVHPVLIINGPTSVRHQTHPKPTPAADGAMTIEISWYVSNLFTDAEVFLQGQAIRRAGTPAEPPLPLLQQQTTSSFHQCWHRDRPTLHRIIEELSAVVWP